ncbi:MAG TPA: cupin domain-containing protein [Geminicoccaceae bacterium]
MKLIERVDDLPVYAPPGHSGTRNVRLVDRDFCGRLEMVLGRLEPGGRAEAHAHPDHHQVIYVVAGEAEVRLGDDPPAACGPGTVIRIPPGLVHEVRATGAVTLELIVLYSPPLPPRDDVLLD